MDILPYKSLLEVNIYHLDQINLTKNQFLSQCITLSLPVCEAQPKQRQKSNYEKKEEILLVLTVLLKKSFQNDGFLILAVMYTIPMKKKDLHFYWAVSKKKKSLLALSL